MSDFRNDEYYENLDKRTKEYKNWLAIKQSQLDKQVKGAGDVVEKITEATGIKKVVKTFFGEDCGCDGRKDDLNDILPITGQAVNCVSEEDYRYLKSFFSVNRTRIDATNQKRITDIYNHVYNKMIAPPSGCATCSQSGFKKAINKLHRYFDAAESLLDK
tara:strand:+ start:162 stop:641 length:480 start_codon:yes stop_codon:yes gene_type:complete